MRMLCATLFMLVGCKSEPTAPPCALSSDPLPMPWSVLDLPDGARVCADVRTREGTFLGIDHLPSDGADMPELRARYVAAFRSAGWTSVSVTSDRPTLFGAKLSWADGSHTVELQIARPGEIIKVSALRTRGWTPEAPEPGSWEEHRDRAMVESQQRIKEGLESNLKKRRR
jgi:hypothetical protein